MTARILVAALLLALAGCERPITLKTIELTSPHIAIGESGARGTTGLCLSSNVPQSGYSAADGHIMVGFDDWFDGGTFCDALRAINFRGGVRFDLSRFDASSIAVLKFQLLTSIRRSGGGPAVGPPPPLSFATTFDAATHPFDGEMRADDSTTLPVEITVGSFVNDWLTGARPNFGFVLGGPRGPIDQKNPPKGNDAQLSWYGNFRLAVTYNPALNPRAPQ